MEEYNFKLTKIYDKMNDNKKKCSLYYHKFFEWLCKIMIISIAKDI